MKYKAHPFANELPLMKTEELEALAEDIRENGLQQPIILYNDQILDGRNRMLACEKAKVEPNFVEHQGDDASAHALVVALNFQRRHLTSGQRAIYAARQWILYGDGTPGRKSGLAGSNSESRISISKKYRVGHETLQQAKTLLEEAPDLAEQVDAGILPVSRAYEAWEDRKKAKAQAERDFKRIGQYAELVTSGDMKLQDALARAIQEERQRKDVEDAQKDERRRWLQEFVRFAEWVEKFVADDTDEELAFYGISGAPGTFDHGITPERIEALIGHLRRAQQVTFGGANGQGKKGSAKASGRCV